MLKQKRSSTTKRLHHSRKGREISPLLLYLIGTTALFLILLPIFLLTLGFSLKSLLIAAIAGFGIPWFGCLCWNFSKMTGARHAEHWLAGFFVRVFAMTTYVLLISIFWSIALTLGYQCHLDINNGPDDY